jgi:hypothetical protein
MKMYKRIVQLSGCPRNQGTKPNKVTAAVTGIFAG